MGSKIDKITKMSDSVEHPKNWGVTYWAKNNMPLFVQIIDQLQKPVFWPVFLTANYLDNYWPILFGPISDPSAFNVFYLIKYSSDFYLFYFPRYKKAAKKHGNTRSVRFPQM
jgi:hypothetical protein